MKLDKVYKKSKMSFEELVRQTHLHNQHSRKERANLIILLKSVLFVEVIVGVAASVLLWYLFSWQELVRSLLSWTIGLTLVSALVSAIIASHEHRMKKR